jgi:SpoVK/Ycf46/Vps4 family AAA+-type ATPase
VICIGATNRPDELDEGARRRFVKRLYIPLPDEASRRQLIARLLQGVDNSITGESLSCLVQATQGYSGADMKALCTEAAMGPVRQVIRLGHDISKVRAQDMSPITMQDFEEALDSVAPSVSESDLGRYVQWNSTFGSYRRME